MSQGVSTVDPSELLPDLLPVCNVVVSDWFVCSCAALGAVSGHAERLGGAGPVDAPLQQLHVPVGRLGARRRQFAVVRRRCVFLPPDFLHLLWSFLDPCLIEVGY